MNTILQIQKNIQRLLLIMIIIIADKQAHSQGDERIALADKYFNAGEYYTAAGLNKQFLTPPKDEIPKANFPINPKRYAQVGTVNRFDILYKQAESYRLAN